MNGLKLKNKTKGNHNELVDMKIVRDSRTISPFPPQICILKGRLKGGKGLRWIRWETQCKGERQGREKLQLSWKESRKKARRKKKLMQVWLPLSWQLLQKGLMNAVIIPGSYSVGERNSLEFKTVRVIECSFSYEYGN